MACKNKVIINWQTQNAPFWLRDKLLFKEIKQKNHFEALNLLLRKWISAGKLVEKLTDSNKPPPNIQHDICKRKCKLPIQYSLLCKYFLYFCLVKDEIMSLSLIHPCWFFYGRPYATKDGWHIRYSDFRNSNKSFGNYFYGLTKVKWSISRSWYSINEKIGSTATWLRKNSASTRAKRIRKAFQEFNILF